MEWRDCFLRGIQRMNFYFLYTSYTCNINYVFLKKMYTKYAIHVLMHNNSKFNLTDNSKAAYVVERICIICAINGLILSKLPDEVFTGICWKFGKFAG